MALVLRLLSMNGWRGPDWRNDASVFDRRTLGDLVTFIDAHLRTMPSASVMGAQVGMTPGHFAVKFRRTTGLSPHRFVVCRRIRRSLSLLRDRSTPLRSVAAATGFSSHSHFSRVFAAWIGMTPSSFRAQFARTAG